MSGIERNRGMTVQQLTSRFNTNGPEVPFASKPPPPRKLQSYNQHKKPARPPPRKTKSPDTFTIGVTTPSAMKKSSNDSKEDDSKSFNKFGNDDNNDDHNDDDNDNNHNNGNFSDNSRPNSSKHKQSFNARKMNRLNKRITTSGIGTNSNNISVDVKNVQQRRRSSYDHTGPLPPPKVPTYVTLSKGDNSTNNINDNNNSNSNSNTNSNQYGSATKSTTMTAKPKRIGVKTRHSLTLNRSLSDKFKNDSNNNNDNNSNNSGNQSVSTTQGIGDDLEFDDSGLSINSRSRFKTFKASFDDIKVNQLYECDTEALMAQMNDGTECLRFFSEALSTFATQQKKQASAMLKLFEKSQKRYAQMEGMPNFTFTMELVHQLLEETVKRESEFASFLDNNCVPMIHKLEKDCEREWQRIHNKSKKELKSIQQMRNNLSKIQKQTKSAVSQVQKTRLNSLNNNSNTNDNNHFNDDKSNQLKKLINNVAAANKHSNNDNSGLDKDYEKAKMYDKQLKSTMIEYKKARNDYVNKQERNKQDIANMEHYRVGTMLQVFRQMASKQEAIINNKTITELHCDILTKTSQMDAKEEIQKFVKECVERHGKWEPPVPPISSFDVNSPEYEYRDIFYSVDDAVSMTRDVDKDAKLPNVVTFLCDKIKGMNGFKTEGIFRISALKSDVKALKHDLQNNVNQYNSIDYSSKPRQNVHLYASLLKEWLRGLNDSVIPQIYYDYCIDMAKQKKLDKEHFDVFFSQMAENNREILKYLAQFIKEIIEPKNVEANKMTLDNLAVVFGPNLLRCPSEDPQLLMMNNNFEKVFFIALIQQTD